MAAVALTCGVVAAAPANAAAHHPLSTAGQHPQLQRGARPATPSTYYGAGYFSYPGSGYVSAVSATFKMPAFSCASSSDDEWLLPGIWVYDSNGTLSQQVDVNFNCNSGVKLQESVIVAGGAIDTSLTPNPGDKIEVSLSETATATIGTVHDITQGTSAQAIGSPASIDETVFVGDEGPSLFGPTAVPTFSKVPFSVVTVDGQYLSDWSPAGYNLNTNGGTQIKIGAVTSGTAFGTKFVSNN